MKKITLENVTFYIRRNLENQEILKDTSTVIPAEKIVAVLGASEFERRILVDLLGGVRTPQSGQIWRGATVSFPLGSAGGFSDNHSIYQNLAHVSRLYGEDPTRIIHCVRSYYDANISFSRLLGTLSSGEKTRLSCIVGLSLSFDIYIINMVGKWATYAQPVKELIEMRAHAAGLVVATADANFAQTFCNRAVVLRDKRLRLFNNIERALKDAKR